MAECCIAGCRRAGRRAVKVGESKLAFCPRCWAYVGATFEWLRRLDELGHLTFESNVAALQRMGEE